MKLEVKNLDIRIPSRASVETKRFRLELTDPETGHIFEREVEAMDFVLAAKLIYEQNRMQFSDAGWDSWRDILPHIRYA
jgi:hypothetical protein